MCNVEESSLKTQIAIKASVFLRELMLNTIVWDLVPHLKLNIENGKRPVQGQSPSLLG